MIIADDSKLRLIPNSLDRKQILVVDGIRYSVDMADLAYGRLTEVLVQFAKHQEPRREWFSLAFQDAWSLVDYIERLRKLIPHLPIKKSDPAFALFFRKAVDATELRHASQHLDNDLQKGERLQSPVWGSLSWIEPPQAGNKFARGFLIVSGAIFDVAEHPIVNPVGKVLRSPASLITLSLGTKQICFSEVMQTLVAAVKAAERAFDEVFAADRRSASDVLNSYEFSFDGSDEGVPVAEGDKLGIGTRVERK
jgi:hypothetical protein